MKARTPAPANLSGDDREVVNQLVQTYGHNKALEIIVVSLMRAHFANQCPCQDPAALARLIEIDGLDDDQIVSELAQYPCEIARKNPNHHWQVAGDALKRWRRE
jgi:hypothetical protein